MSQPHLPAYLKALMKPGQLGCPASELQVIQTHISYVLVAGQHVYKFKKPVNFGFLDFTTLEQRGYFCRREVELNRRLCPDIYLGVFTVNRDGDDYRLNGTGAVIEYGVKMARLPEELMMGRVIAAGKLEYQHLDAIIARLVPFYAQAAGDEKVKAFGRAEAVGVNVTENFQQTESFVDGPALSRAQFDRIAAFSRTVLADSARFDQRIAAGRIRDCHGDLYSANICLDDQIHIFDCIEFNERFRYADVASDVAFLAMDLDYHGLAPMATYFLEGFARAADDPDLLRHVRFYQCYRAYVRGKIGLFTAADPAVEKTVAEACTEQAKRYFELADRYAQTGI